MMRGEDAGLIPVVRNDELVGIVTDRDLAIRVIAEGRDPKSVHIEEVMTPHQRTIGPEDDSEAALRMMNDQQVRRLPVTEGRRLVALGQWASWRRRASPAMDSDKPKRA